MAFTSDNDLKPAVIGTLLFLATLTCLLGFQSYSKFYLLAIKKKAATKDNKRVNFKDIKYYNAKDHLALVGDRAVGNTLEWAFHFLVLLWMHNILIDPAQTLTLATVYCVFRIIYVIFFILANKNPTVIFFATVPMYLVLLYMFFNVSVFALN